jgi:hypothetical protein
MIDDSIVEAVSNSTLETAFLKLFEPDADANKVFTPVVDTVYIYNIAFANSER